MSERKKERRRPRLDRRPLSRPDPLARSSDSHELADSDERTSQGTQPATRRVRTARKRARKAREKDGRKNVRRRGIRGDWFLVSLSRKKSSSPLENSSDARPRSARPRPLIDPTRCPSDARSNPLRSPPRCASTRALPRPWNRREKRTTRCCRRRQRERRKPSLPSPPAAAPSRSLLARSLRRQVPTTLPPSWRRRWPPRASTRPMTCLDALREIRR